MYLEIYNRVTELLTGTCKGSNLYFERCFLQIKFLNFYRLRGVTWFILIYPEMNGGELICSKCAVCRWNPNACHSRQMYHTCTCCVLSNSAFRSFYIFPSVSQIYQWDAQEVKENTWEWNVCQNFKISKTYRPVHKNP